MANSLQELGHIVVQDTLGDLCAEVFAILSTHGRSTRNRLQQLSGLPIRQLKITLACMTQLHILLHQTTDDDQTFYQIDWRSTYSLIRSSRIHCLVEERHGIRAGKVIAFLLQLGHARVQDLAEAFDLPNTGEVRGITSDKGAQLSDNGKDFGGKISTIGQLHATIRKLLTAGLVVKVGNQAYTPSADIQAEIEELVISAQFPDRKVGGPKKQEEFRLAVNSMKRKRREAEDYSEQRDTQSLGAASARAVKRSKLNNGNGCAAGTESDHSGMRLAVSCTE
jgi:DNA-directed RNA polymerase III subunit RPC3